MSALPNGKITIKAISSYLKRNAGRIVNGWYVHAATDSSAEALRFRLRQAGKVQERQPEAEDLFA